jgi:hypothetical protein
MAPTELAALERMGHIATFMRQVPDCFVPVHCPRCERGQITLQTQRDDTARISRHGLVRRCRIGGRRERRHRGLAGLGCRWRGAPGWWVLVGLDARVAEGRRRARC